VTKHLLKTLRISGCFICLELLSHSTPGSVKNETILCKFLERMGGGLEKMPE
jgi:hypothetical protein